MDGKKKEREVEKKCLHYLQGGQRRDKWYTLNLGVYGGENNKADVNPAPVSYISDSVNKSLVWTE